MKATLEPETAAQIDGLTLAPGRPLIVTDADEVILRFLSGLEGYLEELGCYLDLRSFALTGNIRRRTSGAALEGPEVRDLLRGFFRERMALLEPVPGAAAALRELSRRAEVVVLSNTPVPQHGARAEVLRRHAMDFPLVANSRGLKGPAVAYLVRGRSAPVFFLDDIPHNIDSVAETASQVICVHFVADPRLAALAPAPERPHVRLDDWPTARRFIEQRLADAGY